MPSTATRDPSLELKQLQETARRLQASVRDLEAQLAAPEGRALRELRARHQAQERTIDQLRGRWQRPVRLFRKLRARKAAGKDEERTKLIRWIHSAEANLVDGDLQQLRE